MTQQLSGCTELVPCSMITAKTWQHTGRGKCVRCAENILTGLYLSKELSIKLLNTLASEDNGIFYEMHGPCMPMLTACRRV